MKPTSASIKAALAGLQAGDSVKAIELLGAMLEKPPAAPKRKRGAVLMLLSSIGARRRQGEHGPMTGHYVDGAHQADLCPLCSQALGARLVTVFGNARGQLAMAHNGCAIRAMADFNARWLADFNARWLAVKLCEECEHSESRHFDGKCQECAAKHRKCHAIQARSESGFEAELERLSVCACGHGSQAHAADALGNLLACSASGCECDHFHYDATDAAAAKVA